MCTDREEKSRAKTDRKTQMIQNVMDGLCNIGRMKVIMIWIPILGVSQFHFVQKLIQLPLRNLS